MGVSNFLNLLQGGDKIEKFIQLAEGKTEKEKRKIELNLLKPVCNKKNREFLNNKNLSTATYSVKIYFNNREEFELFSKYFRVNTYIENNIKAKPILSILRLLEKKKLRINKKGVFKIAKKCRKRREDKND